MLDADNLINDRTVVVSSGVRSVGSKDSKGIARLVVYNPDHIR